MSRASNAYASLDSAAALPKAFVVSGLSDSHFAYQRDQSLSTPPFCLKAAWCASDAVCKSFENSSVLIMSLSITVISDLPSEIEACGDSSPNYLTSLICSTMDTVFSS